MFVLNCTIGKRSQSQPQSQPHSTEFTTGKANKKSGNWAKRQQKQNRFNNNKNNNNIEVLSTVKCTVCSTEVGVLDSDDIYHFFNVLSSAS